MNKSIRSTIVKRVPFRLRKTLFKLTLYVKAPWLLFLSKTAFSTQTLSIVLLSFPRSGSSWIGSIMGAGDDVRYLREPATTSYTLTKSKHKPTIKRISVFDQDSCDNWPEYQHYIDESLAAKPNFSNAVIASPKQWQVPKQQKKLLIKEVNPLAINYYLSKPIQLIYLVRHPFSVAKSYQALQWRSNDLFSKKFNQQTLALIAKLAPNIHKANNWQQMGYLQGWIEALAKEQIAITNNPVTIIRYEDVCSAPNELFKKLFSFTGIEYSTNIINKIKASRSRKDSVAAGDFSLTRNSSKLAQINIKAEEHPYYFQLMTAYQQAFDDFKQSSALATSLVESTDIRYQSTSYQQNSSLVNLC